MIPDLRIASRDAGRGGTDVYAGDAKLLDVYSLNITTSRRGTLIVATSCQGYIYEGPALLTVDPAYRSAMLNAPRLGDFPEDRTENVRIEAGRQTHSFSVVSLESGEPVDLVTNVSLNLAHDKHEVTVMYLPDAARGVNHDRG